MHSKARTCVPCRPLSRAGPCSHINGFQVFSHIFPTLTLHGAGGSGSPSRRYDRRISFEKHVLKLGRHESTGRTPSHQKRSACVAPPCGQFGKQSIHFCNVLNGFHFPLESENICFPMVFAKSCAKVLAHARR
jgi:hypothetical protein